MEQVHNDEENRGRMPLFLPFELSNKWLREDLSEDDYKAILAFEMPSEELDFWPVFTIRRPKSRPHDKAKTAAWEWEKLPALGEMNPD